jgi:hypothetical protein
MILSHSASSEVKLITPNIVQKNFKGVKDKVVLYNNQLGEDWLNDYIYFRRSFSSLVEVYSCTDNRIEMEYIEGEIINFRTCSKKVLHQVLLFTYDLMKASIIFCDTHGYYFVHGDMNPTNFIQTKKGIRLIEPDGFRRYNKLDMNQWVIHQMRFSTRLMNV